MQCSPLHRVFDVITVAVLIDDAKSPAKNLFLPKLHQDPFPRLGCHLVESTLTLVNDAC